MGNWRTEEKAQEFARDRSGNGTSGSDTSGKNIPDEDTSRAATLTHSHYERLLSAGAALAGAPNIDAFAQMLLAHSLEFTRAHRAFFILDQEGAWSVLAGATSTPSAHQSYATPLAAAHDAGLLRAAPVLNAIRTRRTQFAHAGQAPTEPQGTAENAAPTARDWGEILCAPLLYDGRVIAVLYLELARPPYGPRGVQLIARLMQQAAPRLHSLLEMERLAELNQLRQEMTEALRASEERFRSIFNSSPVMIFLTDVHGRLLMVNDYWLQTLGYARVEVVSRTIGDFCTETGYALLAQQIQSEPQSGHQYENLPVQLVKRNGALLDALVSGVVMHSEVEGYSQCLSFAIDMTTHRRAEQELARYRRRLEELVRERTEELSAANRQLEQDIIRRKEAEQALLEAAAVNERHRLARELHDSVTQALYSMSLFVDATRLALTAGQVERATNNLIELRAMSRDAMENMRALIFELHPPELAEIGLVGALREYLKNYQHRTQLAVEFEISGEERALPVRAESELYRVAQEALSNCFKHARAGRVAVGLCYDETGLDLTITDNGQGFQSELAHLGGGMGIRGMMERIRAIGGQIHFDSEPSRGTTVGVRVQYPDGGTSAGSLPHTTGGDKAK